MSFNEEALFRDTVLVGTFKNAMRDLTHERPDTIGHILGQLGRVLDFNRPLACRANHLGHADMRVAFRVGVVANRVHDRLRQVQLVRQDHVDDCRLDDVLVSTIKYGQRR